MVYFNVVKGAEPPKAVALLLGWYGAPGWVVDRNYAGLYRERGCATITGVPGVCASLLNADDRYDEFASAALGLVVSILRENPGIPLIIHCFSNTGCRALQRFERLLNNAEEERTAIKLDIELVQKSLRAEIFDSAPAIPTSLLHSWRTGSPHACFWVNMIGKLGGLWETITCKENSLHEYWNAIEISETCSTLAFLYSDSDCLCNAKRLEELIEKKRQQGNNYILAKKFHKTIHVNHLKGARREYCQAIDTMLEKVDCL